VHSLYKFSAVERSQIGLYNGNTLRSLRYELRIYVKRELILVLEGLKLLLNVCCMQYTGCPGRNGQNFGRVSLMLNYTDITQNTYIQS